MMDLGGKVALVTGGNGGIGLAMAGALADAGATLALVGRMRTKPRPRPLLWHVKGRLRRWPSPAT